MLPPLEQLLERLENGPQGHHMYADETTEVNPVISAAASIYEKVRYLVDYRDEHTLRRAAIERMLRRKIVIEGSAFSATALLQELVEGKYVEKNKTSQELAEHIEHAAQPFLNLRSHVNRESAAILTSFAASAVEECLSEKAIKDAAVVDAFYSTVRPRILLSGIPEEVADVQVFCACRRAILGLDNEGLSYALWQLYVPRESQDFITIAKNARATIEEIASNIKNPLQFQIMSRLQNESIYFRIIHELCTHEDSPRGTLEDEAKMAEYTREFLDRKYTRENERIQSSGVRAVAYLFLTKMLVAGALEIPYERYFLGAIKYTPLFINMFFHPALLFAATRRVGSLGESNTERIIKGMRGVLYEDDHRKIRVFSRYTNATPFFAGAYALLFLGIVSAILTALQYLDFSPIGMLLFLFFLALVSYFAFRIRHNAKRWRATGDESAITIIANVLTLPIIRTGQWLSTSFKSINIFIIFLDFVIETPFKLLLNFSNQFIVYLREKAGEVY